MSLSPWYRPILLVFLAGLTVPRLQPAASGPNSILLKDLVQGIQIGYSPPGDALKNLRANLPPRGSFTYITDTPHQAGTLTPEKLLIAQNYLAPRLLSPISGQKIAVVDCSTSEQALKRTAEEGYHLIFNDVDTGRGLAVRQV